MKNNLIMCGLTVFSLVFFGYSCDKSSKSKKEENSAEVNKKAKPSKKSRVKGDKVRDAQGRLVTWELERMVQKDPGNIELNCELADSYFRDGKFDKAANVYRLCTVFACNDKNSLDLLSQHTMGERQESFRYLELLSRFKAGDQIHIDCDLAPLADVIALCNSFEADFVGSGRAVEVADIRNSCKKKLFYKSQSIFDYHCNNWLTKGIAADSRHVANNDKVAAQKMLEKIKRDFDVNNPEIAARIAFSEYKISSIEYKIAKQKSLELALFLKKNPKDTQKASEKSPMLSEEEQLKKVMLSQLAVLEQEFPSTKETKAAIAMTGKVLDTSALVL